MRKHLLTAQRGGEVLSMCWNDLELATRWWTIPAERTKNGLPHRVPLAASALRLLSELRTDRPWVFPNRPGLAPIASTQKAIERVRSKAGIELRGHDLRRTAASYMTSMGTPRLVVAKILNHVETGVTAVYDRYSYDTEKRGALDAWAERLMRIVSAICVCIDMCKVRCIMNPMRTNIDLDDQLVKEALSLTGIKTKRELVHTALRLLVAERKRKSLLDLRGKIEFAPGYDYNELRKGAK